MSDQEGYDGLDMEFEGVCEKCV